MRIINYLFEIALNHKFKITYTIDLTPRPLLNDLIKAGWTIMIDAEVLLTTSTLPGLSLRPLMRSPIKTGSTCVPEILAFLHFFFLNERKWCSLHLFTSMIPKGGRKKKTYVIIPIVL